MNLSNENTTATADENNVHEDQHIDGDTIMNSDIICGIAPATYDCIDDEPDDQWAIEPFNIYEAIDEMNMLPTDADSAHTTPTDADSAHSTPTDADSAHSTSESPPPLIDIENPDDSATVEHKQNIKQKYADIAKQFSSAISDDISYDTLPEFLLCNVCHELIYRPVGLQCGHTFCQECLREVKQCPECRSSILRKVTKINLFNDSPSDDNLPVNRALDTMICSTYPAEYRLRKEAADIIIRNNKYIRLLPTSSLYLKIGNKIDKWFRKNNKAKCTFADCYSTINRKCTATFTDDEYLWYYAWLRYVTANIGETHLPIVVFPPTDIPSGNLHEVHLNQYARLFNHTGRTEYIDYVKQLGIIVPTYQVNPDLYGIRLHFVMKNIDKLSPMFDDDHTTYNNTNAAGAFQSADRPLGDFASIVNIPRTDNDDFIGNQHNIAGDGRQMNDFINTVRGLLGQTNIIEQIIAARGPNP